MIVASAILNNRKPRAKQQKGQKGKEEVYRGEIKYTAQRLYEKGVILEIEGLPPSQLVQKTLDNYSMSNALNKKFRYKWMAAAAFYISLLKPLGTRASCKLNMLRIS